LRSAEQAANLALFPVKSAKNPAPQLCKTGKTEKAKQKAQNMRGYLRKKLDVPDEKK